MLGVLVSLHLTKLPLKKVFGQLCILIMYLYKIRLVLLQGLYLYNGMLR